MPCGTSATCDCLCTKVDISGLSYNSISYDTTMAHLPPGTSPDPFCSCTILAVVPMKQTGSGTPGTFDDLTIRVELHDGCILYSEATLAVSGSPVWSGKCTSTVYCTSSRFSCGTVGASGGITLASWSVYGNSFTLTIDGDDCISWEYESCVENLIQLTWEYESCVRP
jgi:hypothetical protein